MSYQATVKFPLFAKTELDLVEAQLRNNIINTRQFVYGEPQQIKSGWVVWYNVTKDEAAKALRLMGSDKQEVIKNKKNFKKAK